MSFYNESLAVMPGFHLTVQGNCFSTLTKSFLIDDKERRDIYGQITQDRIDLPGRDSADSHVWQFRRYGFARAGRGGGERI